MVDIATVTDNEITEKYLKLHNDLQQQEQPKGILLISWKGKVIRIHREIWDLHINALEAPTGSDQGQITEADIGIDMETTTFSKFCKYLYTGSLVGSTLEMWAYFLIALKYDNVNLQLCCYSALVASEDADTLAAILTIILESESSKEPDQGKMTFLFLKNILSSSKCQDRRLILDIKKRAISVLKGCLKDRSFRSSWWKKLPASVMIEIYKDHPITEVFKPFLIALCWSYTNPSEQSVLENLIKDLDLSKLDHQQLSNLHSTVTTDPKRATPFSGIALALHFQLQKKSYEQSLTSYFHQTPTKKMNVQYQTGQASPLVTDITLKKVDWKIMILRSPFKLELDRSFQALIALGNLPKLPELTRVQSKNLAQISNICK